MSAWLAADAETLRVALEIIDTWGSSFVTADLMALQSPSSDSDGSAGRTDSANDAELEQLTRRNQPKRRRVEAGSCRMPVQALPMESSGLSLSTLASTHHRRRLEVVYLRDKVRELESEMATLKRSRCSQIERSPKSATASASLYASVWKDIANRQQQVRQRAETEQQGLKNTLHKQMQVVRALLKLIQKAKGAQQNEAIQHGSITHISTSSHLSDMSQRAHVFNVYNRIDKHFAYPKFHDGSTKFLDVKAVEDRADAITIELCGTWIVPFDTNQVHDALWGHVKNKFGRDPCMPTLDMHARGQEGTNEVTAEFSSSVSLGSHQSKFTGQFAVRKFAGTQIACPAIISTLYSTPSPGELVNICVQEEMCLRVLPGVCNGWQVREHSIAQVQCSQRFTITFDDRAKAGMLTNMMLSNVNDWVEVMHDAVETLLVADKQN